MATELLTVAVHEHANAGQGNKVKPAVEEFGQDLLAGVAMLITFVASTIPFALAGIAGYLHGAECVRVVAARRPEDIATGKERVRDFMAAHA